MVWHTEKNYLLNIKKNCYEKRNSNIRFSNWRNNR